MCTSAFLLFYCSIYLFLGCLSGFTCSKCEKWFSSKHTITKHLIWHHRDHCPAFKFNCSFCPYGSDNCANLRRHSIVHSVDRRFECNVCGNRFATQANLNQHVIIHLGESQESYLFTAAQFCFFTCFFVLDMFFLYVIF